MYLMRLWRAILKAFKDVDQHHLLAFAGSLAYYFFMSLIPFLIFLASLLHYIPIQGLFDEILRGLLRETIEVGEAINGRYVARGDGASWEEAFADADLRDRDTPQAP